MIPSISLSFGSRVVNDGPREELREEGPQALLEELVLSIFRFVQPEVRLAVLPLVCRQFRRLNGPFYSACMKLHRFIPFTELKAAECLSLYALTITEDQSIFMSEANFWNTASITPKRKEAISKLLSCDTFDMLSFLSQQKIFEDPFVKYRAISNDGSLTLSDFYTRMNVVKPFDDQSLLKIAEALIAYENDQDSGALEEGIRNSFPEEEKASLEPLMKFIMLYKNDFFKELPKLAQEKVEVLKKRQQLLSLSTKIASCKVLFFLGAYKISGFEQLFPEVEHPLEHVWFAKKIGLLI